MTYLELSMVALTPLQCTDGEEGSLFLDCENCNTSTTMTAMVQTMKTMMADVAMPAIAPGAMELGPEVSVTGREKDVGEGRGKVKVGVAKANL